jgi:hypothetical protein
MDPGAAIRLGAAIRPGEAIDPRGAIRLGAATKPGEAIDPLGAVKRGVMIDRGAAIKPQAVLNPGTRLGNRYRLLSCNLRGFQCVRFLPLGLARNWQPPETQIGAPAPSPPSAPRPARPNIPSAAGILPDTPRRLARMDSWFRARLFGGDCRSRPTDDIHAPADIGEFGSTLNTTWLNSYSFGTVPTRSRASGHGLACGPFAAVSPALAFHEMKVSGRRPSRRRSDECCLDQRADIVDVATCPTGDATE